MFDFNASGNYRPDDFTDPSSVSIVNRVFDFGTHVCPQCNRPLRTIMKGGRKMLGCRGCNKAYQARNDTPSRLPASPTG